MQGVQRKSGSNEYAVFEIKVYETVDKTALFEKCREAESSFQNIGWETDGADSRFYESLVFAKAVCGDVMAGQEETDAAKNEIEKAAANWKEKKQLVTDAEEIRSKKAEYDAVSFQKFEAAYAAIVNAGDDISAERYEELLKALREAIRSLTKKSVRLAAPSVTSVKSQPTNVKITWNAVANAGAYQLYRKVGSSVTKVGNAVTGTQALDENPAGGKSMSYYVVAIGKAGSIYTDSAAGKAMNIQLPKATNKLTASQVKGKKAVTLKWKKVKGASSYLIFRAEGKKAFKKIAAVKKKITYRDAKKLKKGKSYSYKIVAVSKKLYSPMKPAKKAVKIK